jgi:hypothetical protein
MGDGSAASVSAAETFTGLASSGRKGVLTPFATTIFVSIALLMNKTPSLPLCRLFFISLSFCCSVVVQSFILKQKAGIAIMQKSGANMQSRRHRKKQGLKILGAEIGLRNVSVG